MILLFFSCLTESPYSTGTNNPSDGNYQWGSGSSVSDSGEYSDADTSVEEERTTGYAVGNRAPNLSTTDHQGYPWSLHAQSGTILLIFGHGDTTALPSMLDQAKDCSGINVGVLMGRSIYSSPATPSDVNNIVQEYNLSFGLTDTNQSLVNEWTQRNPPKAYLISEDKVVLWSGYRTLDVNAINQLVD